MLNYEFPPLGGGAGRASFNLSKHLAKKGHQVDVITSKYKKLSGKDKPVKGVNIYRVKSYRKSVHEIKLIGVIAYIFLGTWQAWKLTRENSYDLVHCFFGLPTGIIALFLKKTKGISYVLSLRGSDVPGYDPYSKVKLLYPLTAPLNRKIWKEAGVVVALSNGLKRTAKKFIKDIDYEVAYNGLDFKKFSGVIAPKDKDSFQIICVCRLIKRKGVQYLLEAMSQLKGKQDRLTVVGKGDYENDLKELSKSLGIEDRVKFVGYVPNDELYKWYGKADIFVSPSLAESFGMTFLEAMASGLPIVGTKVGGIPEVVIDGENGFLVKPKNSYQLKLMIEKLMMDLKLRNKMGEKSRQRARKFFGWDKITKQYLNFYKRVI